LEKTGGNKNCRKEEETLDNLNSEINSIIEEQCRGAALRSQCKNYEHGEKATKYYLNMEKSKSDKQEINLLINNNGQEVRDQNGILIEQLHFYKELYSKQEKPRNDFVQREEEKLFREKTTQVEEEDWPSLTSDITEDELEKIIMESPSNKSPGLDGFSNEFYKHTWPILKKHLIAAYQEALKEGEMCISQRQGIISLLPKDGKDLRFLKNWRPLTLLNNDYKYLAKMIANRFKKVLPYLISYDQNGFVPGRLIGSNILRSLDILEQCEGSNIEGLLINIDIEKAFDSVDWEFMYKALTYFNFPEKLIRMVRCLYQNLEICTANKGHTSQFAKVERGMRQGCPLSPTLFIIVIELLNIYIRNKEKLQGITIKNRTHLISQFADDTSFFLNNSPGMIDRLFTCLQTYGKFSGLKLNINKTEILLLGKTQLQSIPRNYRNLVSDKVKSLGITLNRNIEETTRLNFEKGKQKVEQSLAFWSKKPLSLVGKVNILKNQVTPKLTYLMSVLPNPGNEFWKEINGKLFTFIADGKKEKLKRSALINNISKGGAQMIDLESQGKAMRAMWMIRAVTTPGPWADGLTRNLNGMRLQDFLECNLKGKDIPFGIPQNSIWKNILMDWCEINYKDKVDNVHDIMTESVWLNSRIKIREKVLWNRKWYDQGLQLLWDLIKESNGGIMDYMEFKNKYSIKTNFLEYEGLIKAIPKCWKEMLKTPEEQLDITKASPSLANKCLNSKKGSKVLYNILLERKATGPENKLNKWKEELGVDADTKNILKEMVKTRKELTYSKLQSFQYNFTHRNLTYAKRLYKMKVDDTSKCKECGEEEDLKHLYWECPSKKKLWKDLQNRIRLKPPEKTGPGMYLMNMTDGIEKKEDKTMLRTIYTICKHYIHIKRCKGEVPNIRELMNKIKKTRRIELIISTEKGHYQKTYDRWKIITLH
jgi:hypothetical protein